MPDTAKTVDQLLAIFADGQPNNSISEQDLRDFVMSVKYMGPHGWNFDFDSQYTFASPRVISGGARTKITIDGLLESIGSPEPGLFWDKINNKVLPSAINDFGILRLAFVAKSVSDPDNYFDIELDTGGTYPIIFHETGVFAKGATVLQSFNFVIPLFAGPDFLTNGGEFYITPASPIHMWETALTANRTYAAFVA